MRKNLPILLIVALALLVRIIGLDFGLPFTYHDDEPIIVNYALSYGTGDLNPRMFYVPPLLSYLLFFEYGLFYLIGLLLGFFKNTADFGYLFLNDPTIFYLIARSTFGVLPGALSVFFLYRLGRKVFNVQTGIIAALFLAMNFLHVRDSHYIYFDIPLTMLFILLFIKSGDLINTNSTRSYIHTGILIGALTAVKYFGPLLIPFLAVVLAHNFICYRRELPANIKRTAGLILASVVTFFILNPFAFLHYQRFLKTFKGISFIPPDAWFHLRVSLIGSVGLPMLCAGLLGMGMAIVKRNRAALLLFVFVVSYYFIIMIKSQASERYVMPLLPPLLLLAGYSIHNFSGQIKNSLGRNLCLISLSSLLIFPSAHKVFLTDRLFLASDTRTQAYHWIKEKIAPGAVVAIDATNSWFPRLEKSKEQISQAYDDSRTVTFAPDNKAIDFKRRLMLSNPRYSEKSYFLYYMRGTRIRGFHSVYPDMLIDFDQLIKKRVEYVVVSNILGDEGYERFIERLREGSELLMSFSPYQQTIKRVKPQELTTLPAAAFSMRELKDRRSFGPYIEIYRIRY